MYISGAAEQIVTMQMQMTRNSIALATVKSAMDQQNAVVDLLTEATASAPSTDGRGALLDILV